MYALKHSEHEKDIIIQCQRDRSPLPDFVQNAPELWLGLELYYDAFWDLDSCRPTGWSVGLIPWSAINDYANTFEYDMEQRESLFYYIRIMDNAYIKFRDEKSKSKFGKN